MGSGTRYPSGYPRSFLDLRSARASLSTRVRKGEDMVVLRDYCIRRYTAEFGVGSGHRSYFPRHWWVGSGELLWNCFPFHTRWNTAIDCVCGLCKWGNYLKYCYILTFWPGPKCHSRWCTGRKWHIPMAVRRGNRVGGNWLMKWDELKKIPMVLS